MSYRDWEENVGHLPSTLLYEHFWTKIQMRGSVIIKPFFRLLGTGYKCGTFYFCDLSQKTSVHLYWLTSNRTWRDNTKGILNIGIYRSWGKVKKVTFNKKWSHTAHYNWIIIISKENNCTSLYELSMTTRYLYIHYIISLFVVHFI